MSRSKHKAKGGEVEPKMTPKPYNAQGSEVEKEAEEKKRGGRAKHKHGGEVEGKPMKEHLGRAGRARGGRTGADQSPLSTASKVTSAEDHKDQGENGNADRG